MSLALLSSSTLGVESCHRSSAVLRVLWALSEQVPTTAMRNTVMRLCHKWGHQCSGVQQFIKGSQVIPSAHYYKMLLDFWQYLLMALAALAYLINHLVLITLCVIPARRHMHILTRAHHLWTHKELILGFSGLAAGRSWCESRWAGLQHIFQTWALLAHGQKATCLPHEAARNYSMFFSSSLKSGSFPGAINPLRISHTWGQTAPGLATEWTWVNYLVSLNLTSTKWPWES
jgi:hypothetical protein